MNTKSSQKFVKNDAGNLSSKHILDELVDEPKTLDGKLKCTEEKYQYIRLYKRVVELKAIIFLSVTLILLAYLYSKIYIRTRLSNITNWALPNFWSMDEIFYIVSLICCLVSIALCLLVMMPNLKKLKVWPYFSKEIAKYGSQQGYLSGLFRKSSTIVNEDKLIRDLAKIISRKNNALRWGFWSGTLSICLIFMMVLIK